MSKHIAAGAPGIFTRGFVLVAAANICFYLAMTSNLPTFPRYAEARGMSPADIAFIISMMGLVSVLSRPFSGWLIDSLGRRAMLSLGIALFGFASVILGYAANIGMLAAARSLQSTAVGVVSTAAQTYVSDTAPAGRRAEALGYLSSAFTLAGMVGPLFGAYVVADAMFATLSGAAFWWQDLQTPSTLGGNYGAIFLIFLVLAAVGFAFSRGVPDLPKPATRRGISIRALLDRRTLPSLVIVSTITAPFAAILSYIPTYGLERGVGNAGLYFTFEGIGIFIAGTFVGRIADGWGRRPVVIAGMLGGAVAMLLLSLASNWWMVLGAGVLSGFSQSSARNAIVALTADIVPPEERGTAISTISMGFDVGVTLGAPILGVVAALQGVSAAFSAGAGIILVGAVLALFLLPKPRTES